MKRKRNAVKNSFTSSQEGDLIGPGRETLESIRDKKASFVRRVRAPVKGRGVSHESPKVSAGRGGQLFIPRMSIRIMGHVWADHSIKSRAELLVLLAIADFSGDDKPAFPSIDTLAQKSRCTQRAVQKVISRLIASGKLSVEYGCGPFGTNVYKVITGGANGVHPEPSVPKIGPKKGTAGSPNPSGTVRNGQEPPGEERLTPQSLFLIQDTSEPIGRSRGMKRPTLEDVKAEAGRIGLPIDEAEKFFDYHEARGWTMGKFPMKDWKAALRNWRRNAIKFAAERKAPGIPQLAVAPRTCGFSCNCPVRGSGFRGIDGKRYYDMDETAEHDQWGRKWKYFEDGKHHSPPPNQDQI